MPIPKKVAYKTTDRPNGSFTSCPRESCHGDIIEGTNSEKDTDEFVCQDCLAEWHGEQRYSTKPGVKIASYIHGSCRREQRVEDSTFYAYRVD